jgi:Zn-dependent M28 family amino/carboxypeptidase
VIRRLLPLAIAVAVVAGRFEGAGRPEGLHYTWTVATADGDSWWKHVEFLASDRLQGRNTGTPAHKRAAEYVAEQFKMAGLEPAGTSGYIQTVAFKTRQIDESHSSLSLIRGGRTIPLTLGEHANFSLRIDPSASVDAPLVFVGHGLDVPEQQINDLDGLNLKGAIVVYVNATPRTLPGALQAHFGSTAERWHMYRAAGAVGTISIANPKNTDIPWSRSTGQRLQPAMSLADPLLDEYAGQQVAITMNPAYADLLFEGSGHTFDELLALDDQGKPLPRFVLPARVSAQMAVVRTRVDSQNVAGILRGSDPARRGEFVVLSAHLDHLGVGDPIKGDAIYNGAMDNASGVAAILEVAARTRAAGERPARSIVFVAVTGEEKGELGSRYFAAYPTVPRSSIVADINTDMFLPLFPLKQLMVLGLDESDLGDDVRAVADALHLEVQRDPEPQRNRFIRSDQYSFVRAGIPALAMKVGYQPNTPQEVIAQKWTAERYHAPSDDLAQPVDRACADAFVDVVRRLALRVANRPDRPRWSESSFFRRFAQAAP